jgi:hypothetical protein
MQLRNWESRSGRYTGRSRSIKLNSDFQFNNKTKLQMTEKQFRFLKYYAILTTVLVGVLIVALSYDEENGKRKHGLTIADRPVDTNGYVFYTIPE